MFIGLKELQASPGRTTIITLTITMIAMLVTFLSSLAAGLAYESVSALQIRSQASTVSDTPAIVIPNTGSTSLLSSRLSQEDIKELSSATDGHIELLYTARATTREGEPIIYMSEPNSTDMSSYDDELISISNNINTSAHDSHSMSIPHRSWQDKKDLKFDHLSVEFKPTAEIKNLPQASSVALIPPSKIEVVQSLAAAPSSESYSGSSSESQFTTQYLIFEGKDRWKLSASYSGEQMSLNLMIVMLYIISALIIGAFFMVWTMQRLRSVSISFALGASRRFIITDSLGQAIVILCGGVLSGLLLTYCVGISISDTLPIQLTSSTLLFPALFLGIAGMIGAVISILPILKVSPRDALVRS